MSAVLKESKATRATPKMPRGQADCAQVATKKREKAIKTVPTKDMLWVPSLAPTDAVAAIEHVPKGPSGVAAQHLQTEGSSAKELLAKVQTSRADALRPNASESATHYAPRGHRRDADHSHSIAALRELHRRRQDFHRAEKSLTLQVKAMCRRLCAGDKDEAGKLYTAMEKGVSDPQADMARMLTEPFIQARSILEGNRKSVEKDMERAAKILPVADWVAGIKGFGIGSLAAVIGEAGDLSNYPTHSHLWKRLGMAVIDGGRQRLVTGADALIHGYSPSRRSVIWNIGQCVFKSQSQRVDKETGEVKTEAGDYRKLYDARKEYELPRCEAISENPEERKKYQRKSGAYSAKAHAHNRSVRYIEKKLMRDLWKAWRERR